MQHAGEQTLKEQLKLLIELQVHDAKIQELEGALKAFPARFESMQTDVKRVDPARQGAQPAPRDRVLAQASGTGSA